MLGVGAVVVISTGAFILGYTFAVNSILSSPNADATSSSSTAGAFISASSSPPNNNVDTASERAEMMRNINDFQQSFHKTDKTFMHGYHWFYGRHLPYYKGKEDLAILEIGSRRGDSALAWKEYFGSNTRIDMITYGGSNDHLKFDNPTVDCKNCGIHTFYCDQSDAEKLEKDYCSKTRWVGYCN